MLAPILEQIDQSYLLAQCADGRAESLTLDFKRVLPGKSDADKVELLKDVSAMANTDGGDIVYGLAENQSGEADHIEPISGEAADAAVRRITNVLDALEPRVRIQTHVVDVTSGYVLVLRVPASFDGPHSARLPGQSPRRFVVRNGTSTTDMSYDQLRAAFDRTATLQQRAGEFRIERLSAIRKGNTPVALQEGPICVLHVVPLSGLARRQALDIGELFRGNRWAQLLVRLNSSGASRRLNLEGGVAYTPSRDDRSPSYVQVFRNGCIEASFVGGEQGEMRDGKVRSYLWTSLVADHYRNGLAQAFEELRSSGFEGPAVVGVSLLRAEGFALATNDMFRKLTSTASSANPGDLVAPEEWIDQLEIADVDAVIRPAMDTLWQAFDVARCNYFDEKTGAFLPNG